MTSSRADGPLAEIVRQAMQAHGNGKTEEAQALYEQVLAQDPDEPDALHLMGVLQAQQGRMDAAAQSIARALQARPGEAMFHNNLGNVEMERGRFDDAERHYIRAIELDPARLDALNNLGVLLGHRGDDAGAEKVLLRLLELSPGFGDARQNLANVFLRQGRYTEAIQQCFDGLITAPRSTPLRRLLGIAYSTMGMNEQAIEVYRQWLQAEPGHPIAEHHLRALTGEAVPERAADAYVTRVFDAFANSFDAKLAELGYRAPQLVADAVRRELGEPAKSMDVLDAGCGTGLCAPLLAPYARRLAGVDLSEGMLHRAVARRLYDELVCGELVAYLKMRADAWHLLVSADTLCYFGALEGFAQAAFAALRAGGLLVFTVESLPDDAGEAAYRLQQHGRYSHRRAYVMQALAGAGFTAVQAEPATLRMEANTTVQGWVVTARRPH